MKRLLRMFFLAAGASLCGFFASVSAGQTGLDVDSGLTAEKLFGALRDPVNVDVKGGWVRLRGIAAPGGDDNIGGPADKVQATREALAKLHARGLKTCVMLRWPGKIRELGAGSPESEARRYLPEDLRDAYANGHSLGAAYGDLVDAWEIDNEPDLGAVPELAENYAAFLKAHYLGFKEGYRLNVERYRLLGPDTKNKELLTPNDEEHGAGSREEGAGSTELGGGSGERRARRPGNSALSSQPSALSFEISGLSSQVSGFARAPLVLMGALGLPPGPWLEHFSANDGFSHTDGFNFHYYGYGEDFSAVYRQHENALSELSRQNLPNGSDNFVHSVKKDLPIFLTEIGYGMLGKSARDTKEGRLRQWRWFKAVGEQVTALRPEAPMAFYLQPYLEYDTLEFGLTVPKSQKARPEAVPLSAAANPVFVPAVAGQRDLKPEGWEAGGITYTATDFASPPLLQERSQLSGLKSQVSSAEPWLQSIGKEIGGNEITPALAQWLSLRAGSREQGAGSFELGVSSSEPEARGSELIAHSSEREVRIAEADRAEDSGLRSQVSGLESSRPWTITASASSPVVIDFIAGEGLQPIKRFNGIFVVGRSTEPGAGSKQPAPRKPNRGEPKANIPEPRSEEFMIHVRTANGNLYEVYPTRQATAEWQTYLEPKDNFTMSFYGRADLPWRFQDNRPASLVLVMYPKELPAVYEFRRARLVELGKSVNPEVAANTEKTNRYGWGKVVLYNFSQKVMAGVLRLPGIMTADASNPAASGTSALKILLQPNERREIPVQLVVDWGKYERIAALVRFIPEDESVPAARFRTDFIPDIGGLKQTIVTELTEKPGVGSKEGSGLRSQVSGLSNVAFVARRPRVTEEVAETETSGIFAQPGATVTRTGDGFVVTVTGRAPGKERRIEVEVPWPDGMDLPAKGFLSVDYRLGGAR